MAEFFEMGGYALYVWSSFGATALFMLAEPLLRGPAGHRVVDPPLQPVQHRGQAMGGAPGQGMAVRAGVAQIDIVAEEERAGQEARGIRALPAPRSAVSNASVSASV